MAGAEDGNNKMRCKSGKLNEHFACFITDGVAQRGTKSRWIYRLYD